jgi:hypothetical protein
MTRMMWTVVVVVLAISVTAALTTASAVRAEPAAQVCPKFSHGRLTFTSETLGNSWTCAAAKSWILRVANDRIRHSSRNIPLRNGPRGYHCIATPVSRGGHATSGACFKGTIAFPGTGFAWDGS